MRMIFGLLSSLAVLGGCAIVLLGGCAIVLLGGCAAMEQNYRENYCNYDGAFKLGMNDAQAKQQMNGGVASLCDAEIKPAVEKGYREGYMSYVNSQPKVEININNGATPSYGDGELTPAAPIGSRPGFGGSTPANGGMGFTPSIPCRFTTDCAFGKNCRDRGDGIKLCLGNEGKDGYCEVATDCGSTYFCHRDARGLGRCN